MFPVADILVSGSGRLVSGNCCNTLKLWSTVPVSESRFATSAATVNLPGLTLDDEMTLDGMMTSAAFDETLDMVKRTNSDYNRCVVVLFRTWCRSFICLQLHSVAG